MENLSLEDLLICIVSFALLAGYCYYFWSFPEDLKNGYKRSNQNNYNHEKSKNYQDDLKQL